MKRLFNRLSLFIIGCLIAPTGALALDGLDIPTSGLTLRLTQDSPTSFGNSGGTQASTGGSELNQLFADVSGTTLSLGMTGNLEGNFNKLFIFFDAVAGGENTLAGDNVSGGFNQVNGLAGVDFAGGATMDHGLMFEVGGGSHAINFFDLITNTASEVAAGGGTGDFPLTDVGGVKGVTVGWDNSNAMGVTDTDVATADSATTGWEIDIDLVQAFNGSQGDIGISAVITSGDGSFISSQVLPGLGLAAGTHIGNPPATLGVFTLSGSPVMGNLPGDVDGDGDVDLDELPSAGDGVSDFDIIRANWLETNDTFGMPLARTDGDLNEDGEVGIEDFREWKNNVNASAATIAAAFASLGTTTVPEPASVVTVGMLAAGLLVGLRRRQS